MSPDKDKIIKFYLILAIAILAFLAIMRFSLVHLSKLKLDYYPPNLELAKIFSDHMLFQRKQNIIIWGSAHHDKEISIEFDHKKYKTKADEHDKWKINLGKHEAGGPYQIKFKSDKEEIILDDVLIGDQWLVIGESIVNFPLSKTENYAKEIKTIEGSTAIRYYDASLLPDHTEFKELNQEALWQPISAANVTDLPAVPYYLAKYYNKRYKVPVGIIKVSEDYIPIKTLLSVGTLNQFSEFQNLVVTEIPNEQITKETKAEEKKVEHHYKSLFNTDLDLTNATIAKLSIDKISEGNICLFINDKRIGCINESDTVRAFDVPASWLKSKYNKIELRINNVDDVVKLAREQLNVRINLSVGTKTETVLKPGYKWNYRKAADLTAPALIYNEMIQPLLGLKFQGIIIYSGESDLDSPDQYKNLLPAFIGELQNKFPATRIVFFALQNIPEYNPHHAAAITIKANQQEVLSQFTGVKLIDIGDLEFGTGAEEMAARAAAR